MKLVPKSSVTDAIVRRDTTQIHTGKGPCAGGARSWRDTVERLGALRKTVPPAAGRGKEASFPRELHSVNTGIQSRASGPVRRLHIAGD